MLGWNYLDISCHTQMTVILYGVKRLSALIPTQPTVIAKDRFMGSSPIWSTPGNWNINPLYGDHDQYDNRQKYIQGLNLLDGNVPPGGPGDHRDRFDSNGYVFSWDPEANHGKGAWAWSGFLISGHPKPGDPGFDASKDVDWASPKQYGMKNYGDDFYDV